ncbi:phosphopantetheine-binding protein [Actinocorallia sp. API 0066]|uniref:phosphopantetheine-binding protein n=1 Tax=Actinocorallia sp. API 0066 TaxID=2896846 RepID=UPI001E2BC650|nr:phosphopantetheine-binding protein [Actinocorallia sp. API 0066]MCD0451748.1 phosphopantetheine-binding protein [Actinocorallia sp. API 0066]
MTTIDEFVSLVQDELGLDVTPEDVGRSLDELAGWDSLHLLTLATLLERTTGRSLVLTDLLEARSLERIYAVAVGA